VLHKKGTSLMDDVPWLLGWWLKAGGFDVSPALVDVGEFGPGSPRVQGVKKHFCLISCFCISLFFS
jgi:hypothetical protein